MEDHRRRSVVLAAVTALVTVPGLAQEALDVGAPGYSETATTTEPVVPEAGETPVESIPVDGPATEAAPAEAVTERHGGLEEIVVTAQRRSENLQDVPISVSTFSEEMIENSKITSFSDVAKLTPGFVFAQTFGQVSPTIRGVGADRISMSSEPGVAMYVDDIYMGRPYLPQAALTQVERIEILKGPQGTLYGRNTSGGALKIVTKRPATDFEADLSGQAGSFDQRVGQGSITLPIADTLRVRLSGYYEKRDGYVHNVTLDKDVDGHKLASGRVSIAFDPFDWMRVDINGDMNREKDSGPIAHANNAVTASMLTEPEASPAFAPYDQIITALEQQFGPLQPLRAALVGQLVGGRRSTDPRVVYQDHPTTTDIDNDGVGATIGMTFGSVETKIISGYRDSTRVAVNDSDLTDAALFSFDPHSTSGRQTSVELQASSTLDMPWDGSLNWLAGAFYYDEKAVEHLNFKVLPFTDEGLASLGPVIPPEVLPLLYGGALAHVEGWTQQKTKSKAVFADLEWSAAEWIRLHLGGRYTHDEKAMQRTIYNPVPGDSCMDERNSKGFSAATARAGIDFPFADDQMLYLSYSQGFKSGGFNGLTCHSPAYDPEYLDAYEIGFKSRWFDGRMQVNAATFHYDFTDIQVEKVVGLTSNVENAAKARIKGAELQTLMAPVDAVTVDASVAYLDARYRRFFDDDPYSQVDSTAVDLKGNYLNKAPKWQGAVGASVDQPIGSWGKLSGRVEWTYTGSLFWDQFNHDYSRAPSYHVWNVFANWASPSGAVGFQLFCKNLTDEEYQSGGILSTAVTGGPWLYYGMPRTVGAQVTFHFD